MTALSTPKAEKEQKGLPEKAKVASDTKKVYNFPRATLNEALRVAESMWEKNDGHPFALFDIAKQLGYTPTSGCFREIIRSSQKYGLTNEGMSNVDFKRTISLSALGNSIVAPTPEENAGALKRRALENIEIFQKALNVLNEDYSRGNYFQKYVDEKFWSVKRGFGIVLQSFNAKYKRT